MHAFGSYHSAPSGLLSQEMKASQPGLLSWHNIACKNPPTQVEGVDGRGMCVFLGESFAKAWAQNLGLAKGCGCIYLFYFMFFLSCSSWPVNVPALSREIDVFTLDVNIVFNQRPQHHQQIVGKQIERCGRVDGSKK